MHMEYLLWLIQKKVKTGPRRGPKTLRKSDDRMRTKIYSEKTRM